MATWKARPTIYRGIPMRSRLEARAAAGMDDIEVPWLYEPRAYAGRGGQYLPDFEVHPGTPKRYFVEVRPTEERARAAFPQMEIILESEPDAFLMVVFPDPDGHGDRWGVFMSHSEARAWR